jgi:anti-sigma B factor antagonist
MSSYECYNARVPWGTLVRCMSLDISHTEKIPGKVVVALAGKLMMGSDGEPIVALVDDLLRQGKRIIVFDLGGLTVIDSTGIGRFIGSFNKIVAAGGEMRMAGATGHILHSFKVSLLDQVFPFYASVEEAVKD